MQTSNQYYRPELSLNELYMELGTVEYNLEVLKTSLEMLTQAKSELVVKIQAALQSTDADPEEIENLRK